MDVVLCFRVHHYGLVIGGYFKSLIVPVGGETRPLVTA